MEKGRFGIFGGQYVPETLMNEIHDLTEAYERYKEDSEFQKELGILLRLCHNKWLILTRNSV